MRIEFGFGKGYQPVEIPDQNLKKVLNPNLLRVETKGAEAVRKALAHPIGSPCLGEIVRPGESVVIVTSDITRPMPTAAVMPPLLDVLYRAGVHREDITLVFALGSHRKHTQKEREQLAGPRASAEIRCVDSDASDCVLLGTTRRGTPVDIFRIVAEADHRICLGNIEFHYFAGYSGGAKAIMPGTSTRTAIQSNHRMMVRPEACAGLLEGNPLREDIEEAADICGVDFILNVVLDEKKEIVKAVAGDVTLAHREGCRFLDQMYKISIDEKADIVLVSQGGAPKDLNLYQVQKALENAKYAVKPGGIIILIGSCQEGLGEKVFSEWMASYGVEERIQKIQTDFQLGGHKAAAIALVLKTAKVYLVSEMEPEFVNRMGFSAFSTVQAAFDKAMQVKGEAASVLAMPYGGSTVPVLAKPVTERVR